MSGGSSDDDDDLLGALASSHLQLASAAPHASDVQYDLDMFSQQSGEGDEDAESVDATGADAGSGSGGDGALAVTTTTVEPPGTPILDHHLDAFRDFKVAVTPEVLAQALDELTDRWLHYAREQTKHGAVVQCAYKLFGFHDSDAVSADAVANAESTMHGKVLSLYYRFVNAGMINQDVEESLVNMNFTRILETVSNMASIINLYERTKAVTNPSVSLGASSAVHKWELALTANEDEQTKYQKFLLYLLNQAYSKNLRKYNGRLYKQVVVNMYRTHAWTEHSDISEFVYSCAKKEQNFEMWLNMTSSHANISNAIQYLEKCTDFELPTLQPNRHIFSFRNCIYDAESNTVYEYANPDCHIPSSLVAAKFFDLDFPIELASVQRDWRDICTAKLDHILNHQRVPTELHTVKKKQVTYDAAGKRVVTHVLDEEQPKFSAKEWFYIFIGRMIYEIHEHDDWQVLLFIKGVAGSGKSTLGKIVSYLYDVNDVGVLSNNTEKKFGLSALVEKLIYVCYEVKNDFALDQGEFQCMVSGEQMAIPFKFQTAQSIMWRTHGMFMGNEVASWCDNSGSMSRRIVLGLFNELVTEGNPRLFSELQEEMAHILLKCNRAYREAAYAFGALDVWNVLPEYFVKNRRQLRAHTHPLAYFLENTTELVWDTQAYMSLLDLQLMMNVFLSTDGSFKAHKKGFNVDFYQWVMDAYHLTVQTDVREYKGSVTTLPFVTGITDKSQPHYLGLEGALPAALLTHGQASE